MQRRGNSTSLPSTSSASPPSRTRWPWDMTTSLILAVLLVLLVAAAVTTVAFAGGDNYLYHHGDGAGDDGQTLPVMEHLLPKDRPKPDGVSSPSEDAEKNPPPPPEFLFPQGVARVVEFYAPWCGHCRHFASHYVDLAKRTQARLADAGLQRVEFHAVSCVAHKKLCNDHGVHGYPTVVACKMWSDCGASYDENGENGGKKGSPIVLEKSLLTPEYVAEQLGIPLKGGGGGDGGGDAGAATSAANDAPAVDEQKGWLGRKKRAKKAANETKKRKKALTEKIFNDEHARTQEDLYSDAAKSFYFSLEQGVYPSNGPLPPVRRGAFVDWVNLLSRSLPAGWTDVQSALTDLQGHFVEGGEDESPIFRSEGGLMTVVNPHRQDDRRHDGWSANCGTKPGAGYTCGLWGLFHVMSVGVAERNFGASRGSARAGVQGGTDRVSTLDAAEALRGFVANFFGCQECRTNFLEMYDSCKFDRCTRLNGEDASSSGAWREFALWLWEVHNDVNVRLGREEAGRWGREMTPRDVEEARWPSRAECGQCWHDDGSWNENTVYLYLKHVYWPGGAGHASFLAGSKPAATGGRRKSRRSFVFERSNGVATFILFFLALLLFVPILFHRKKVQWTGMHKKSDSAKMIV